MTAPSTSLVRGRMLGIACVAALAAACSADVQPVDGDGGAGSGGAVNGPGGGGADGAGGQGGAPFSCDQCAASNEVCVDGAACAATCPADRAACSLSTDPSDPPTCCEGDQQCCSATANGYTGADVCHPASEPCPIQCPDGVTCGDGYCALDAESMTYTCAADCNPDNVCGTLCCPLGSTCGDDGSCVLADLTIDAEQIVSSAHFETYDFQEGSCSFFEGCIGGLGERKLLRFDLRTPNIGDGDMLLGNPNGNPIFEYSTCHDHYHFNGYANYRLLDLAMNEVATGHKQAFCLLDWEPYSPDASPNEKYHCGYQGIQKGWADTYVADLPCQWIDVTDNVPPGDYLIEVTLNIDHALGEKDYTNNQVVVPITIPAD